MVKLMVFQTVDTGSIPVICFYHVAFSRICTLIMQVKDYSIYTMSKGYHYEIKI